MGFDVSTQEKTTYQLLEHSVKVDEAKLKTTSPNLDLIPSHIDLVAAEIELVDEKKREFMLRKALESAKDSYDFIFIDCAPSLGLITLNALTAADSVIIPIQCEYFALEGSVSFSTQLKVFRKYTTSI